MAEVFGVVASAISIAALFTACIEAFDVIKAAQSQELDFHKAVLKLNIEKCRLYTWGEAMGLTSTTSEPQASPIDSFGFRPLVIETLRMLLRLFSDTSKLQDRYGCRTEIMNTPSTDLAVTSVDTDHVRNLSFCFADFTLHEGKADKRLKKKLQWVVHDRKKFPALVADVKDFVDGLQDITKCLSSVRLQTHTIANQVCETDHPALSDAASIKLEIVSIAQSRRDEIDMWKENIEPPEDLLSGIESLTVTELKHRLLGYMSEDAKSPQRPVESSEVGPLSPVNQQGWLTSYEPSSDFRKPSSTSFMGELESPTLAGLAQGRVILQINGNKEDLQSSYQVAQLGELEVYTGNVQIRTKLLSKNAENILIGTNPGFPLEAVKSFTSSVLSQNSLDRIMDPAQNRGVTRHTWGIMFNQVLEQLWYDPLIESGDLTSITRAIDETMGPNNAISVYLLLLQAYRKAAHDQHEAVEELWTQVDKRVTVLLKVPGSVDLQRLGAAYQRLGRLQDTKRRYSEAHRSFETALRYVPKGSKLSKSILMEICTRQQYLANLTGHEGDQYLWAQILENLEQPKTMQSDTNKSRFR